MKHLTPASINPYIGQRIRMERRRLGISQETLAQNLNISPNYIGEVERGKRVLSLSLAEKLCSYFHITLDYLYRGVSPDTLREQICYNPDPYQEMIQLVELCSEQEVRLCLNILRPLLTVWRSSLQSALTSRGLKSSVETSPADEPPSSGADYL